MRNSVDIFWNEYMIPDVCPPLRYSDKDRMREQMPETDPNLFENRDDLIELVQDYSRIDNLMSQADRAYKQCEQEKQKADAIILKALEKNKAKIVQIGEAKVTRWKQQYTSINLNVLKAKYPDAFKECVRTTTSNRYDIKIAKVIKLED